jgi:hypothetical protein
MTEAEREHYLENLDETLFRGMSVEISAWAHFLILDSDVAFIKGADLAAFITALCGIETQLRFDHSVPGQRLRFVDLIDQAQLSSQLKSELHELRRYRNKWVHVSDPWDESLVDRIDQPELLRGELESWALRAVTALRQTFYWNAT